MIILHIVFVLTGPRSVGFLSHTIIISRGNVKQKFLTTNPIVYINKCYKYNRRHCISANS